MALVLLAPAAALARAPKLSLSVPGAPHVPTPGNPQAAQTGTNLVFKASARGTLAPGAKLRLQSKPRYSGKFKTLPVRLQFHHGRASVALTSRGAALNLYRLVEVSTSGKVLAHSPSALIQWIAPPARLFFQASEQAFLYLNTGKLQCNATSGPSTCIDNTGTGSGGTLTITTYSMEDRMPGTRVSLIYQGQTVCASTAFDGQCRYTTPAFGQVKSKFYVTAQAQYTSLSGQTSTLTLEIAIYP